MGAIPKISDGHEYVLDTSVVKAAIINYADEMRTANPSSSEDYDSIHSICFSVLIELSRAKIALDCFDIIRTEYIRLVFDPYPSDFPTQWFTHMESRGQLITKDICLDRELVSELRRLFGLSKVDSCLIHVATKVTSKKVIHRDNGISNAAGFIRKNFGVDQINVMK